MAKISLTTLNAGVTPAIDFFVALAQNTTRGVLGALSIATLTDSTTGTAGSAIVAVATQDTVVVPSGANLAPRVAFNTAIGKTNNAIAVLATYYNVLFTALGLPLIALGNGTVAVAGTLPAQDKTLTGTDGSASAAMLRSEYNAAITRARNNMAVLIKAYNTLATAIGVATLTDSSGGSAGTGLVLANGFLATTAVASIVGADLASDAAVDAALTVLANNIATLAAKTSNPLLLAGTISARVPILLVP